MSQHRRTMEAMHMQCNGDNKRFAFRYSRYPLNNATRDCTRKRLPRKSISLVWTLLVIKLI